MEIHNAGVGTPGSSRLARHMARRFGLPVTGSRDAHALNSIGAGLTRFEGCTADDLYAALAKGETFAEGTA